jgi:hypothetical protein
MRFTAIKWITIVKYRPFLLGLFLTALIIGIFFFKKNDGFVANAADKAKGAIQNRSPPIPNPLTTTVKEVGMPLFFTPAKPNALTATAEKLGDPIVYLSPTQSCPTLSPMAAAAAAAADARAAADAARAKVAAEAASKVIAKNILDGDSKDLARNTRYGCNVDDVEKTKKSNSLDNLSGTGPDCACQDSMPSSVDC